MVAGRACAAEPRSLVELCAVATENRAPSAGTFCLAAYNLTRDSWCGGRAARYLATKGVPRVEIERRARELEHKRGSADAWNGVGIALENTDKAGAIAAFQRAMDLRDPLDFGGRVEDLRGMLRLHASHTEYREAARFAGEGYSVALRAQPEDRAYMLLNIIGLLVEMGTPPVTSTLLEEATSVVRPESALASYLYQKQGHVLRARGRVELAQIAYENAQAAARLHQQQDVVWSTQLNLVDVAIDDGDRPAAGRFIAGAKIGANPTANDRAALAYYRARVASLEQRYDDAVSIAEAAWSAAGPGYRTALDGVAGRALLLSGKLERAEAALSRAVDGLEASRAQLDNDAFKSWVTARRRPAFEDLFLLYVRAGRIAEALAVAQRATARSILDGLAAGDPRAPDVKPTAQQLDLAAARFEGLRHLVYSLRGSPAVVVPPISELLQRLGGAQVLTYFRARDELWLVTTQGERGPLAFDLGSVARVRKAVDDWMLVPEGERATELGNLLLPAAALPPAGELLFIVPDEPVDGVSFAALRIGTTLLVDRSPVAYAASASVLATAPRRGHRGPPVVLGDSDGDLSSARNEVRIVARKLGVEPVVGAAATRKAITGAAASRLLHVATHTRFEPTGPVFALSGGGFGSGDVLEERVAPEVVVLLSCASAAVGDRDELKPLMTSFAAAGSWAVVGTRWSIDDAIALRFAVAFYEAGGDRDPVRAVAAAQRKLRDENVPVKEWAPYVVMGGLETPLAGGR
jgi:hypothetical protein